MSSQDASDPRLLLPEWLRDGDTPLPLFPEAPSTKQQVAVVEPDPLAAAPQARPATQAGQTASPFSERLTIDTSLDPAALVSITDLPVWLGGLEHQVIPLAMGSASIHRPKAEAAAGIEVPTPYEGVDAPEDGVIDVQVNGWYLIAAAIGLLILLAAAVRLYLT
jgi:hypothetical protein